MKSAKEWEIEMRVRTGAERREFIRQVQADAMRHCEEIARVYASTTDEGRCWPAHTIARLLEREISHLNEKEDA